MNERLEAIRLLRESEDHVEFKEAKKDFNFKGGKHTEPKDRRHCVLGYVVALANEGGGMMVFGMADKYPHEIVGSVFGKGEMGDMEAEILTSIGIRVHIEEEYDDDKRVMIINVPSRPKGRYLTFEGVPLMRVGEELRVMTQDEIYAIMMENEPDFSETICEGLCVEDLDENAIKVMKERYAAKNNNPAFRTLPNAQVLNDLGLVRNGRVTYAALILLGKAEVIHRYLPQNNVVIEYRNDPAQIQYDGRVEYQLPLCIGIDTIWNYISQPALNPQQHIRVGARIYDILRFNEESVREAVLNAVAHRSMRIKSDVVIKISPKSMVITNAGGFPQGVSAKNILTINSVPRCKLLADVLHKTGYVEKSGQGVDKIYYNSIVDSKPLPDYTHTDDYQVELVMETQMRSVPFVMFVRGEQDKREVGEQLNVFELLKLYKVCFGENVQIRDEEKVEEKLLAEKLLRRHGSGKLMLGTAYAKIVKEYTNVDNADIIGAIRECFAMSEKVSRQQIMERLPEGVTVDQVKYVLKKLEDKEIINRGGKGKRDSKYVLVGDLEDVVI